VFGGVAVAGLPCKGSSMSGVCQLRPFGTHTQKAGFACTPLPLTYCSTGSSQSIRDGFLRSEYSVRQNAVKSIIFKAASFAATYILGQSFSFLAYQRGDCPTFLMFQDRHPFVGF